jgi:SAM-dependent methyltransferase
MKSRIRLQRLLRPRGKDAFVNELPPGARVFDIGCGNRSPERVKVLRPDVYYVGLDVQDYAQDIRSRGLADEYRITTPERFASAIAAERETMDAVISSHNLEHCDDPDDVIRCIVGALKPGGRLYLSFPCEASVRFPSRRGCLRFDDDPTHRAPPRWTHVVDQLSQLRMRTAFAAPRYRPWAPAVLGALLEPLSVLRRRVMPLGSTWALWGFESVIWAVKDSTRRPIRGEHP